MRTLKLVLVAVVSLVAGWFLGTVMPWWATALMIAVAVAYVVARMRST